MSTPTSPGSALGEREEELLQTYFTLLSQFAFDKAKELVEKERDAHKPSFGSSWGLMVHSLIQFSQAEKGYMTLGFLEQKWFGRSRDSLRNSYHVLFGELRRIEDGARQQEHVECGMPGPSADFEILLAHLCGQLCEFVRARQKNMDFYEQISTMGTNKNMNYEDLVAVITEIIQSHSRSFHHPILSPLKSEFTSECDCINHLLQAQLLMSEAQFLPSLLQLHQAHSKLTSWGALAQAKEYYSPQFEGFLGSHKEDYTTTKKSMFGSVSKTVTYWPALYQWLLRYKCLMLAKFSLYFYDTLSKQTSSSEMKTISAKNSEDFMAKVIAFQKKTDAVNISLVLDTQHIHSVYLGPGYHHPDKQGEPRTGLDSYPAIFSYPGERYLADHTGSHWPNVVMMINDRHLDPEKIHSFYDKNAQKTYFITCADPHIIIVVISEGKKSEKDSYVNNFMLELSSLLRCTKLFSSLRPGSRVGGSRK